MEIIEETEKACLSLERKGKAKEADTLRHEIGSILLKAKAPRSNLTADEKKGMSHLMSNKDKIAIVPFDKGQGFVCIDRKKLVEKVEKEFNNVSLDTKDTTQALQSKTQNKLRSLYKQDKLEKETYQKLYPSVALTPTANPAIKAHKPNKDYPARVITSHIGAPQENLASHLNEILKPLIEKSAHVCKNSTEFVNEIKQIKVGPNERMVSFDATALFPSVPIGDATQLILHKLQNDSTLPSRTRLSPDEICDLISLCLSSSNFIYDGRHHTQKDSGPIGLSLMVTLSQLWMIDTMDKAILEAKRRRVAVPRKIFVYMDDCWCLIQHPRPGLRSTMISPSDPAEEFNACLNSIHERVQFTREEEEENRIAFLDVLVTRNNDGTLSTSIFRKPSNTNVTIKPQSCQHPGTVIATFKAEICRAYRLCSSLEQTKKEIQFTIDLFEDNGHDRKTLEKIANSYKPPKHGQNTSAKSNSKSRSNVDKKHANTVDSIPDNLFDVLPFRETNLGEQEEHKPYIVMTYLPNGIFHQVKRACNKAGINVVTRPGTKLTNILCSANRTRHQPNSKPGVYKLNCPCAPSSVYVGQTIRPISTRGREHERNAANGKFHHSGITQHKETCNETVVWEPEVLTNMTNKNKKKLAYDLKVREALEIRRHNCGPGHGLNEDMGAYVKTSLWNPIFHRMNSKDGWQGRGQHFIGLRLHFL